MSENKLSEPDVIDTGFSESWLALREPADHAARNSALDDQLAKWFKQQDSHRILELGAGTGSNLRYLMPKLGHQQHWLLIDNDAALFARLPELLKVWACANQAGFSHDNDAWKIEHKVFSATIECKVIDLANELENVPSDNIQLLTASALLDLTSASWLDRIAAMVNERQCACLFTLNYDGRIQWHPELAVDSQISALLNEHQLNDKGFGKALGPGAGQYLIQALQQSGSKVVSADSDWTIKPESIALQTAIVDGWAPAALEQDSSACDIVSIWQATRLKHIVDKTSTLTVGHHDVLSLP